MNFYVLQEKVDDNTCFDLYTHDLSFLKKMIIQLKRKDLSKKYRIVKVYR